MSLVVAICLAAGGQSAFAQTLSPTVYVGQSIPLNVPVIASVNNRCGFADGQAPNGSYDAGSIDTDAWTHDFPFVVECNVASRVAIVSTNGGLLNAGAATDPGYIALAPYDVSLNLVGNGQSVTGDCAVSTLASAATSPCGFLGPATASDGLRLPAASSSVTGSYVRVSAPAYAGPDTLVAGNYADTLTVTIAPAP